MSWAADEWKDGLPPAALQKISQIEAQFERLKKDRDQKQCQLESIEVVLQNQKKKTEEERTLCAQLERENKMLSETCEGLQKKHSKLQQDLQIKEGAILNLDSKLSHYKQKEENEKAQASHNLLRSDLEKLEQENRQLLKDKQNLTEQLEAAKKISQQGINDVSIRQVSPTLEGCLLSSNVPEERKRWMSSDWKEDLSLKAQQHLTQLEQQVDKLKRERDQRQCQLDSLEQAFQNQKKKTEEEKTHASSLQRELIVLSETCEELEQKKSKLQHEVTNRENQIAFLSAQLSSAKSSLEQELVKSQEELQKLKTNHAQLEREVQSLRQSNKELSDKMAASKITLQSHDSETRSLRSQLDASVKEKEKIGNMLDNKVAENISLSEIVNNLQNKLQYQTDLCNTLKATLMDKDLQMESTLADNDHLKTVAKEKDLQLSSLQAELETLKSQFKKSTDTSNSLITSLKEELSKLTKMTEEQFTEKEEKLAIQIAELDKVKKELDKVRHCYTELNIQNERLRHSIQEKERENASLKETCRQLEEDCEASAESARRGLDAHASEVNNMQTSLKQLKDDLEESQKASESLLQDYVKIQQDFRLLSTEKGTMHEKVEQLESKLQERENVLSITQEKCRLHFTFSIFLCSVLVIWILQTYF